MTVTPAHSPTITSTRTAEQLAAGFNHCFEALDDTRGVLADDVFADLYPPFWRFQLRGRDALCTQLRADAASEPTARLLRVVPTTTGFVMEHEEVRGDEVARRMWLCDVHDGLITAAVGYCNGGWDRALRARHAAEAPMLRPWETQR